jgi:predicted O-methyltransferase YrrM
VTRLDRNPLSRPRPRYAFQRVAEALRTGHCPADRTFDCFLPDELRSVSGQYWTPLAVAKRAAEWFDDFQVRTVADIGSGAGKFCVAAALAGECRFTGLEERSRLVAAARTLAQVFGVEDRVRFVHGAVGQTALPAADAYYLYNPFGVYFFGPPDDLDGDVAFTEARRSRDVAAVEDLLRGARPGTCVLTYNGFGGQMPAGYERIRVDVKLPNELCLWRKEPSPKRPEARTGRTAGRVRRA